MSHDYPLGRIHPHGHSGQSVYQLAAANKDLGGSFFGPFLLWSAPIIIFSILLGVFGVWLIVFLIAGVLVLIPLLMMLGARETSTERVSPPPQIAESELPQCDRELLQQIRLFRAQFQTAARLEKWCEAYLYICIYEEVLRDSCWTPFLERDHPNRPMDSRIASGQYKGHLGLLRDCETLKRYVIRRISKEELALVDKVRGHYDLSTGKLDHMPEEWNPTLNS